jgi:molybdopterin-guanine dinucleotide biosynthesis protein A
MGGRQKALLVVGGRPILDRQLDVLRELADPIFIVGAVSPAWAERGLAAVADEIPGCGALGGIYTAIVRSPRPRTIIIGCDMPHLSRALLRHMIDVDADIVIPRSRRGLEPLCAIYARACAGAIRERLQRGEFEAAALPGGVSVKEIAAAALDAFGPDDLLFANVNTPHDYERARTIVETSANALQDRIMDGGG